MGVTTAPVQHGQFRRYPDHHLQCTCALSVRLPAPRFGSSRTSREPEPRKLEAPSREGARYSGYFLGGLLPRPPPEGFPVVLGPFGGLPPPFPLFLGIETSFQKVAFGDTGAADRPRPSRRESANACGPSHHAPTRCARSSSSPCSPSTGTTSSPLATAHRPLGHRARSRHPREIGASRLRVRCIRIATPGVS